MSYYQNLLDAYIAEFTGESTSVTTDWNIDAIEPKSLEELYIMNGSKFPFTAVKVAETLDPRPNCNPTAPGLVLTLVGDAGYVGDVGARMFWASTGRFTSDRKAWQFADPDFKE
jgi:hypothetical protein